MTEVAADDDFDMKTKKKIQSSIPQLSVGDERKCFNQIRKASSYIKPESLLWNGWPAGKFALDYVIGHHHKRKKKAEEKLDAIPEELRIKKRSRNKVFDELEEIASLEAVANTAKRTFDTVNLAKKEDNIRKQNKIDDKPQIPIKNIKKVKEVGNYRTPKK